MVPVLLGLSEPNMRHTNAVAHAVHEGMGNSRGARSHPSNTRLPLLTSANNLSSTNVDIYIINRILNENGIIIMRYYQFLKDLSRHRRKT